MATVTNLIQDAARQAGGVLALGAPLTSAMQTEWFRLLNTIIDSCNAQRLMIYEIAQISPAWAAGVASKTIGPSGADITASVPAKIESAFWRSSGGEDTPVDVVSWPAYDAVANKTMQGSPPTTLFYHYALPRGTIYLASVPGAAGTLFARVWTQLVAFAAVGDTVTLPPGYYEYLMLELAAAIARENGKTLDPDFQRAHSRALGRVKAQNHRTPILQLPPELQGAGRFDIFRGY